MKLMRTLKITQKNLDISEKIFNEPELDQGQLF
jgi:hypothetical protein